jgi:hypothetical protein
MKRALTAALLLAAATAACAQARTWVFDVRLDGQSVGEHRFELAPDGDGLRLRSEARFVVRLLGIPVYRYRHTAEERWRGGCLQALDATTDDDGRITQVQARAEGGQLRVTGGKAAGEPGTGCVFTFAYWNPDLRRQARLLNPQTGELEPVRIERITDAPADAAADVLRWRIQTRTQPIDLLLSPTGEWVGLESTVAGGKRLAYRPKP